MRIGYPCINRTLECKGNRTFRLRSYSKERLQEVISNNLNCLKKILEYNVERDILFFRLTLITNFSNIFFKHRRMKK